MNIPFAFFLKFITMTTHPIQIWSQRQGEIEQNRTEDPICTNKDGPPTILSEYKDQKKTNEDRNRKNDCTQKEFCQTISICKKPIQDSQKEFDYNNCYFYELHKVKFTDNNSGTSCPPRKTSSQSVMLEQPFLRNKPLVMARMFLGHKNTTILRILQMFVQENVPPKDLLFPSVGKMG